MTYPTAKIEVRRFTILSDFMDEFMPCDCNPQAWADWLSKPQPEFGRDAAAQDGDRFDGFVEECSNHQVFPDDGGFYAIPPMPQGWTSATADQPIAGISDGRIDDLDAETEPLNERELAELAAQIGPYGFTVTRNLERFTATYKSRPDGPRLEMKIKPIGDAP